MAPLTLAAVASRRRRKLPPKWKWRRKKKKKNESESLFSSLLNSPLSYRPCRVCWLPLSPPPRGTRRSGHVANAWHCEGRTGKSTTQSTLAVEGKGHRHLSWCAAGTGNLTQERYPRAGKLSPRWDFSPFSAGAPPGNILLSAPPKPHNVSCNMVPVCPVAYSNLSQDTTRVTFNTRFWKPFSQDAAFDWHVMTINCSDLYWHIINANSHQWNNTELSSKCYGHGAYGTLYPPVTNNPQCPLLEAFVWIGTYVACLINVSFNTGSAQPHSTG